MAMTTFSDLQELGATAGKLLVERGERIGVAESSTGGLMSAALLTVPGASAFYLGAAVIYTAKSRGFLFQKDELPEGTRGATDTYAKLLSLGVTSKLGAQWGLSETGAAGPTGNPYGDPAGHSWVGVASPDGSTVARNVLTGEEDRSTNMFSFSAAGLELLIEQLTTS